MPFDEPMAASYDWRFIAEALVLGTLTALTHFRVYIRALRAPTARARHGWIALSAIVAGFGLWAINLTTTMAFDPGVEAAYHPGWAALALVSAVALAAGIAPITMRAGTWLPSLLGGAYIGATLGILQVLGLLAWTVQASLAWPAQAFCTALALGSVGNAVGLRIARTSRRWWERAASAALMTSAVMAQHAWFMRGLELRPLDGTLEPLAGIPEAWMALVIAAVTLVLAGGAFTLQALDRRAQKLARQRTRELADAALDGLVMCEAGLIVEANAGFAALVGVSPGQLRGRSFADFVAPAHRCLVPESAGSLREVELLAGQGTSVPVEIVRRDLASDSLRHVLALRDVRERREAEQRIRHLAYHDALTGLPNRVLFRDSLDGALARARRHESALAVLCLDLDHFKGVNDALGHPVGDALLRAVAERLRACAGDGDVVARLGGDEFAIVQPGGGPDQASALASQVVKAVSAPYDVEGHRITIGVSIGIAVVPGDGDDPDRLLKNADIALYRAKADGRRGWRFFEPEMDARLQDRRALETDLRDALAKGEFSLVYQPLLDLSSGRINGCEALLRWHHPVRGTVSPLEFIPIAEETGLIVPLGDWVLRTACAEAAGWPGRIKVAVNLSPAQFKVPSLAASVLGALAASGLSCDRLELEITETVLLDHTEANRAVLHQLRALGVGISMDDFGTGYSSLSYLRSFPFDKIKIDRSFVKDLPDSAGCLAIIRAVAELARSLGMTTTAEGVESERQLELLRVGGCTQAQGYLLSRPLPAMELARFLDRDAAAQAA